MRDFILIIREAESTPLTREELLENIIVEDTRSAYGYWITPEGHAEPVDGLHFQTLIDMGTSFTNSDALREGWIRVTLDETFAAEMYAGCVSEEAVESLRRLAEAKTYESYSVDVKWDDTIQRVLDLNESVRDELFEAHGNLAFTEVGPFLVRVAAARSR